VNEIVLGVLGHMLEYATISERTGGAIFDQGVNVTVAIGAFNGTTESRFQVSDCGLELRGFGNEIVEVDQFVRAIAEELRAADVGIISVPMGAKAAKVALAAASGVERFAGDVSIAVLSDQFGSFDTASGRNSDGLVSVKDIERIAKSSKDPVEKSAAKWLLEHRKVIQAIDRADSPNGFDDDKISKADITRYIKQRKAFQVMLDNFVEFDGATTKKAKPSDAFGMTDGKVSRKDVEKVAATSADPVVRQAALDLLNDDRALNQSISFDDDIAGRYELQEVATQNGEPTAPLKMRTNWARKVGCTAASELSVLGYVDLVRNPTGFKEISNAARNKAEEILLKNLAKNATKKAVAKSAAAMTGPAAIALATGIDLACRATAPRTDWGTVRSEDKKKEGELTGPPSTPQVMAQK
jgi:hypothetical protein